MNMAYWKAEYSEKLYLRVVEDKSLLHQVGVKDRNRSLDLNLEPTLVLGVVTNGKQYLERLTRSREPTKRELLYSNYTAKVH